LPPHRGVLRHLAAGMAVLGALGVRGLDLDAAADAVDVELEGIGPELSTPVNPAKLLANSVAGSDRVVWVHADPVAEAFCHRAVAAFTDVGRITASSTIADAVRAAADEQARSGAPADPLARLFHDEELDGAWEDRPVRHLGMVLDADEELVRPAAGPLGDVEWITDRCRGTGGDPPAPFSGRVAGVMARTGPGGAFLAGGGLEAPGHSQPGRPGLRLGVPDSAARSVRHHLPGPAPGGRILVRRARFGVVTLLGRTVAGRADRRRPRDGAGPTGPGRARREPSLPGQAPVGCAGA